MTTKFNTNTSPPKYLFWALVVFLAGFLMVPLVAAAAHSPEWTNLNDSDPGITLNKPPAEDKGEKGGTADINIGVGELWEDNRETSLEFLRERARAMHDRVKVRFPWDR